MTEEPTRSRLGRGLAALIGDVGEPTIPLERPNAARTVPTEFLRPNPKNPRKAFDDAELENLANSIREKGIIQPLVVRVAGDQFELIAGERRWRAAALAGLAEVPVIERVATDAEVLE
ncbi:MAG: ParB N-terminal domain-containing protein, partial [bacterium]